MMKPATTSPMIAPSAFPMANDEFAERPTAIKRAEQNAVAGAMADFTRRTSRMAFAIALGLLLVSLALAAAMGFRAVTRSQVNYSAFKSDLNRFAAADSAIVELRSLDAGTFAVYLYSASWEKLSSSQQSSYCESLNTAVDLLCHDYDLLGKREQARVYYYDQDGAMLAAPGEGLGSVLMQ